MPRSCSILAMARGVFVIGRCRAFKELIAIRSVGVLLRLDDGAGRVTASLMASCLKGGERYASYDDESDACEGGAREMVMVFLLR